MSGSRTGYDDVSEFLFALETDKKLYCWEIEGLRVWDYIRAPLQRRLFREVGPTGDTQTGDSDGLLTYFEGMSLWGRNLVSKNPLFEDCAVLSYGTGRRKRQSDGLWWDIYFDPLYTETELDYLHLDPNFENEHKKPAKTEHVAYNDFIHYSGTICQKLGVFDIELSHRDRELIADIEGRIDSRFGVGTSITPLLKRRIREDKARKLLYDLLCRRLEPDIVLLTCSYGRESFVRSCKDNGIPVAELQHGAIDPYHPGYSFPGRSTKTVFPDYLLTWGEFWKENIEFPIPDENIMITGYPYMESQTEQYESLDQRDQIVVISQPNVGPSLSQFTVQLAGDERVSSDIVYKLHPNEYADWRERYSWLADSDVTVVDSDNPPLYQLFSQSRILLGVYSTAVYEGFNFGLETFLLDEPGISTMEWLFDLDTVHVIDSVPDFIEQYRNESNEHSPPQFFADNSIDRLERAIGQIVGSNRLGATE